MAFKKMRLSVIVMALVVGALFILKFQNTLYRRFHSFKTHGTDVNVSKHIVTAKLPIIVRDVQNDEIKERETDIFKYEEPLPAGTGTFGDELRRYNLFISTQGAVCTKIVHYGGVVYRGRKLPEWDPDGLWYMCLDDSLALKRGNCLVYSVGIKDEWSFDDRISNKLGCQVFAFDPTMEGVNDHNRSEKVHFFNLGLSDVDSPGDPSKEGQAGWKTRTLTTLIKELGHESTMIDMLKIDIEGNEWKCLTQMMTDGTLMKNVKQLGIEFHITRSAGNLRKQYGMAMWLDRQGFKIAFMHLNMHCKTCYEVTYINTNIIKMPNH